MGCNGKGSGVCLVFSGRRASAVILFFAILGLGAGKALPQAPAAPGDANTFSFGDQQVGTRSDAATHSPSEYRHDRACHQQHSSHGKLRRDGRLPPLGARWADTVRSK